MEKKNVFVVVYNAEYDCETYNDVYAFDSYEKAHETFVALAKDWFNEDMFNTEFPTTPKVWADGEYDGCYVKFNEGEELNIEEVNNVVNYLHIRVEKLDIQ